MSWLTKLKSGLSKTSDRLGGGISDIFTKRKLDDEALEELEELLIQSDMGAAVAARLVADLAKEKFDKEISSGEVKQALAAQIAEILEPVAVPLAINRHPDPELVSGEGSHLKGDSSLPLAPQNDEKNAPHVILVVGVNGNGKTTTIGKLAKQFSEEGKSVMLAAADTFRAAAVEQLQIWGERVGCEVITAPQGADSASVAYQAHEKARQAGVDVLLIDTAGRLQNKSNLMEELKKIVKVLGKQDESAPHTVLQVLDATTGQNALSQVETFREMVGVTGLVVTKLDGTAKGGMVVALAQKFELPIHAIGVGESIEDLKGFTAVQVANRLLGIAD